MTRHARNRNEDIPGAIYLNKNRYWWKVKLPGEEKMKARPLRPIGAKYATIDHSVACEVARNLWQQAVYRQNPKDTEIAVSNIASLIAAYLKHCDEYYLDENGKRSPATAAAAGQRDRPTGGTGWPDAGGLGGTLK